MPALPTLTVSQAHFDRLVAAFPGNAAADKTASYQAWLTNHLIDYVESVEARNIDEAANASKAQQLQALRESLPPRVTFPPEAVAPAAQGAQGLNR